MEKYLEVDHIACMLYTCITACPDSKLGQVKNIFVIKSSRKKIKGYRETNSG